MRERLLLAPGVLLLVALQTSLGGAAGPWGLRPDFLLLFVLAAGMRHGEEAGVLWGLGLGWLQDALSAGLPGMNVLTKGLLGLAAGSLREQLDCENPNTQAFVAAAATVTEGLVQLSLLRVFSAAPDLLAPFLGGVLPAAAAHGALLPAAAAGIQRARRALRRPPRPVEA